MGRAALRLLLVTGALLSRPAVAIDAGPGPAAPPPLTPVQIAERTLPSVVLIRTPEALGTGFVVRADGRIATNFHVLGNSREAKVTLPDKRELEVVAVVAADEKHDVVVLQIDAKGLVPLTLGNSDDVKPGEAVVAIGHPLGLGNTVSNGLVSAVRELDDDFHLLQISAPISQGSSGGPLIDDRGAVIGLSTLVVTEGQNLNFGMPINYLRPLVDHVGSTPLAEFRPHPVSRGKIRREIPNHPLSLLRGCSDDDLRAIRTAIGEAIEAGAPLYNDGNHAACFQIYKGAALDLQRTMKSCAGPRKALLQGVKLAADTEDDSARAWRMRDAFDGVIDVIERRLGPSEGGAGRDLSRRRLVPKFDASLLDGCSGEDIDTLAHGIAEAIDVGAPLYNQHNIDACARIYHGAVLDLIAKMRHCKGVRGALKSSIAHAEAAETADETAWDLRDTFDGLVDVITRVASDRK